MTPEQARGMTTEQLVEAFLSITTDQQAASEEALFDEEATKYNALFEHMIVVEQELKVREGDQRRRLLPLLKHPNPQVRLAAARATLAVAPSAARQALQDLADSKQFPQAGDAGMSLVNLERGRYKPT